MNLLPNIFYKKQIDYDKRKLEDFYKILNLNDVQTRELRNLIDTLLHNVRQEMIAPEKEVIEK